MKKLLLTCGLLLGLASHAAAQTRELTVGTYVTPQHGMSKWIEAWAAKLEEKSEGRLKFNILAGAQMGPPPAYYDLAANGVADITWILHGATPGRFPLVEVSNMPFIFCSAEQATLVLNAPEIRAKYFDAEHRGVKVMAIFAHPPGQIMTSGDPILSVADMSGKAMRPASRSVGEFIAKLGARPVGLPPTEMAEALQKGTLDGTFIDYGGAAFAFQLGPFLSNVTEVNAYISTFAIIMNQNSYDSLSDDLKAMIDESFAGVSAEIGKVWDGLVPPGKGKLTGDGVTIQKMPEAAYAELKAIGDEVTAKYVAEQDSKGLPASDVLQALRDGAEKVGRVGPDCQ